VGAEGAIGSCSEVNQQKGKGPQRVRRVSVSCVHGRSASRRRRNATVMLVRDVAQSRPRSWKAPNKTTGRADPSSANVRGKGCKRKEVAGGRSRPSRGEARRGKGGDIAKAIQRRREGKEP